MVYFITALEDDEYPVKIGVAVDPRARLAELQTSCPYRLDVVLAIRGGREVERRLHREFRQYRLRGEWFERKGEVLAAVWLGIEMTQPRSTREHVRSRLGAAMGWATARAKRVK